MKTASIHQLKSEMLAMEPHQIIDICLKLAKFKKENKEYLDYLVWGLVDSEQYVEDLKLEISEMFQNIQADRNFYFVKKSIRKIQRFVNRYCKYLIEKELCCELRLFYVERLIQFIQDWNYQSHAQKIVQTELGKIKAFIGKLHEDYQFDYTLRYEELKAKML
jgi:hypothetical protein